MTNPLHTLREALGEANNALGWASSMLIEGVEFYTVREVLHAAQKDAMKCHLALTRAEAALREMEASSPEIPDNSEPRYTVEEVFRAFDDEDPTNWIMPLSTNIHLHDFIKRRLAAAKSTTAGEE